MQAHWSQIQAFDSFTDYELDTTKAFRCSLDNDTLSAWLTDDKGDTFVIPWSVACSLTGHA
jgi:hypothetical protein